MADRAELVEAALEAVGRGWLCWTVKIEWSSGIGLRRRSPDIPVLRFWAGRSPGRLEGRTEVKIPETKGVESLKVDGPEAAKPKPGGAAAHR